MVTPFRSLISSAGIDGPRGVHNDDPAATQGYRYRGGLHEMGRAGAAADQQPGGHADDLGEHQPDGELHGGAGERAGPGSTTALEAVDDRILCGPHPQEQDHQCDDAQAAHAIEVNASGVASSSGGRDAMRWYEIQNFGATPSVRQSGTMFHNAASSPRYYWMGSVNMSGQGHARWGFARCDG